MTDWPSNAPPETLDLDQRTPEWMKERLGRPTASQFDRIDVLKSGPNKGDWTDKAYTYLYELLGERRLKRSLKRSVGHLPSVQYGRTNEDKAAESFALFKGVSLENGKFTKRGRVACSPDRLIGTDELLEVKCPEPPTLIRYLLEGLEGDHWPQIQGQLMITGRQRAHFWAWRDDMPPYYQEVERDEVYITNLWNMLEKFCDRLDKDEIRLQQVWPVEETNDAQILGGLG